MFQAPDLTDLAVQVADGIAIDWATAESECTDPSHRELLQRLRLVERVARLHASLAPIDTSSLQPSLLHPFASEPDREAEGPVTWGPLTIVGKIGRGTFGDVYRARDPRLDRPVALKLLRRRERHADALEQAVIEEGRLMARVRHPNVVTIYGAERIDGRVGLWMELVDGRTLEDELREHGPYLAGDILRIGIDLSRALAAVHRAGLLHRDLKAQNVMRDVDGRTLLTDFGAGRELTPDAGGHELAGTPLYLAPEVLAGQPASQASDIYSLGVLLHHIATGSFPVRGRSLGDLREAHARGARTTLRETGPDLAPALVAAVDRALSVDPMDRYHTAIELEQALVAAATPETRWRYPLLAAALATAALVIVTTAVLTWRGQPGGARQQASDAFSVPAALVPNPTPPSPGTADQSVTAAAESLNFKGRDWVLITRFENRTGEGILDGTLDFALERELSNSAFVNVAPRERIDDVLQLMRKPIGAVVDDALGREVALRDGGVRALLTGRVEKFGGAYVLTVKIVDPATGAPVKSLSEEAASQGELQAAVRREALRVREELGEMLATIQASGMALEKVSTPSLHALQLYSQASTFMHGDKWREDAAEPLLKQAIAEDPTFASAHILLAWAIHNQDRPREEFMIPATRAMELAAQTSDVERYFIMASYYDLGSGAWSPGGIVSQEHFRSAIGSYEALMLIKPDHYWAVHNLAHAYRLAQQEPEATEWAVRVAEVRSSSWMSNLTAARQYAVDRRDLIRARPYFERTRALHSSDLLDDLKQRSVSFYGSPYAQWEASEDWTGFDVSHVLQRAAAFERRPELTHLAVSMYVGLGRFDDAERVPPTPSTQYWPGNQTRTTLMWVARAWLGDGQALAHRKRLLATVPTTNPFAIAPSLWPFLVTSYVQEGDLAGAREVAARADAMAAAHEPVTISGRPYFLSPKELSQYAVDIAVADGRLEDTARLFQAAKDAGAWGVDLLRMASEISGGWRARGDLRQAIRVLAEATKTARQRADAYFDDRCGVAYWIGVRNELAELYYATGLLKQAKAIDAELQKLLRVADPDHPILLKINARKQL